MDSLKNTKVIKQDQNHNTIINCDDNNIGEGYFTVIAGPCAIEDMNVAITAAKMIEKYGAVVLRGSLYKPRTSPYSFQGVGEDGIEILAAIKSETNLLIESEILSSNHIPILYDYIDIVRIGSRNMDNYELLKEVGKLDKPVILKRGISATLEEFLFAAEYVMDAGNEQVILCERGIRSFETYTRNTLDILAIPALKELTHLPVIVDPSHSSGKSSLVPSACKAALAAGADGLIIEVHPDPSNALSDGAQSIDLVEFKKLMEDIQKLAPFFEKEFLPTAVDA
jgi:3-deoxy-7-phosphoheptulonate synthase